MRCFSGRTWRIFKHSIATNKPQLQPRLRSVVIDYLWRRSNRFYVFFKFGRSEFCWQRNKNKFKRMFHAPFLPIEVSLVRYCRSIFVVQRKTKTTNTTLHACAVGSSFTLSTRGTGMHSWTVYCYFDSFLTADLGSRLDKEKGFGENLWKQNV